MRPDLSLAEKCCLALRLAFIVPAQVSGSILRTLFIVSRRNGYTIKPYIVTAILRALMMTMTPRQLQYCAEPTNAGYRSWITSRAEKAAKAGQSEVQARLKVDVESLDTEVPSNLLWVGDRCKAKKAVLFLHGGGYFIPLSPGHLEWCWRAYVAPGLEEGGVETAVAILEYTVTPVARFPTQLRQAASGLSHILAAGFRPQDVIIGGDSAGGNLAMQILCHLIQPLIGVPEVKIAEPLGGAFLVSPALTRRVNDASFVESAGVDMINPGIMATSRDNLLEEDSPAVAFPLDAEDIYLERLETVVSDLLVTVGEQEAFRDQVVTFIDRVRRLSPGLKMQFDLQDKMAHDFILLEGWTGVTGPCLLDMQKWIAGPLTNAV